MGTSKYWRSRAFGKTKWRLAAYLSRDNFVLGVGLSFTWPRGVILNLGWLDVEFEQTRMPR